MYQFAIENTANPKNRDVASAEAIWVVGGIAGVHAAFRALSNHVAPSNHVPSSNHVGRQAIMWGVK